MARFDEEYYRRHYFDRETRVASPEDTRRLARFVLSYLEYLGSSPSSVLDVGCGIGLWRDALEAEGVEAEYVGVEISDYLCERYGWRRGSVDDLGDVAPADLVICQGVLQYLPARAAQRAIRELARVCSGALYLEVLTREDWERNCVRERTDGEVHLRSAAWYRRHLGPRFVAAGGGVFLHKESDVVLFELERG